jgi:catechol 2,3-dioxygenase-like lactoylglutathione lyase family enzyme
MTSDLKLDFMVLYVSDLEASLTYFCETLGMTHVPEEDGPNFKFISGGGENSMNFGLVQALPDRPAGAIALYFKTANLAESRVELVSKGVEATSIEQRPFGSVFTVYSLDGHILSMMSS